MIINKDFILDFTYPIGSIYMSVNSTSPEILFGGTWEQLQNRFLIGASSTYTAGATGGNTSNTHKHLMPLIYDSNIGNITKLGWNSWAYFGTEPSRAASTNNITQSASADQFDGYRYFTSDTTIDIMPPYLAVYMWKRIS